METLAFGSKYDVAIVGARCAGAATAMLLARAGARVLLVERTAYGADTVSTHALMRGAVVQLHRWGVLPRIVAAGTPPITQTTFYVGSRPLTLPIKPRHGTSALYAPRRTVLDRTLVDAARESGVEVRFESRLVDLLRSPSGRVRGGVLVDRSGRSRRFMAKYVVGADGMRSAVARRVGAPVYRVSQHATGSVYGYWRGLAATEYEWHYQPGASAGVIPTNDGLALVFVSVPAQAWAAAFAGDRRDDYLRVLAEAAPSLAARLAATATLHAPDGAPALVGFSGQLGYFRQSHGPGWALVGDAGYFKDPLTAHGITDALRDAELLAGALQQDSAAALAAYQTLRDQLSDGIFRVTDAIASFEWTLDTLPALTETLAREMAAEVNVMAAPPPLQATA